MTQVKEIVDPVTIIGKLFDTGNIGIVGITTGAYIAGDAMGTEQSVRVPKSGRIDTVIVTDMDAEELAFDIVFFVGTIEPTANKDPFDMGDPDRNAFIGHISVTAADYASFNDNSIATINNVGYSYVAPTGQLKFYLVTRGVPDFAAIDDLGVRFIIYDYEKDK